MTNLINEYYETGFDFLTDTEAGDILDFIDENEQDAPTLYRGLWLDESPAIGDYIELHDMRSFASMTPDPQFAYTFGDYVLVVEGLSGYKFSDDEWFVASEEFEIVAIEEKDGVFFCYCE